jgi:hypothetical protein
MLDEIPAAELPTALVFLQFLRERGSTLLLGSGVPESASGPSAGQDSPEPADEDRDTLEKDAAAE